MSATQFVRQQVKQALRPLWSKANLKGFALDPNTEQT